MSNSSAPTLKSKKRVSDSRIKTFEKEMIALYDLYAVK